MSIQSGPALSAVLAKLLTDGGIEQQTYASQIEFLEQELEIENVQRRASLVAKLEENDRGICFGCGLSRKTDDLVLLFDPRSRSASPLCGNCISAPPNNGARALLGRRILAHGEHSARITMVSADATYYDLRVEDKVVDFEDTDYKITPADYHRTSLARAKRKVYTDLGLEPPLRLLHKDPFGSKPLEISDSA